MKWIVAQNNGFMVNLNHVSEIIADGKSIIVRVQDSGGPNSPTYFKYKTLAVYSSEERAREVFGMIMGALSLDNSHTLYMPKE